MIAALTLAAVVPFIVVNALVRPVSGMITNRGYVTPNFRGRLVPTAGGISLLVASLVALAVQTQIFGPEQGTVILTVAAVGASFAALGLIDDLVAPHNGPRGWRGHLRALKRGQLSTGVIKLGGGIAVAWMASVVGGAEGWQRVVDAVVVAGSADVANLLDTSPRRSLIWSGGTAGVAMAAGALAAAPPVPTTVTWPLAVVCGSLAAGFWPYDSRQEAMLGDTGAYLLGGMAGTVLVSAADWQVRLAAAGVVLGLELLAMRVSLRGAGRWCR